MNLKMLQYPSEFSVVAVDNDVIVKEIKNVDCKKPVPQDIPVKQSKLHNDIFFQYFYHIFNVCIEAAGFPNELKLTDINSVF